MVRVLAPAKLNLGLRILDRRPDGYHEIETVFVPLHLCDEIEIEPGAEPGVQLRCNLPGLVTDERNLVVRAALATCDALGVEPSLRVSLHKRIPVAAGLGGGSSDAAATIRGIESLLGRQLDPGRRRDLARQLGADVPFFLDPRPALGRGIGEILEPIEGAGATGSIGARPLIVLTAAKEPPRLPPGVSWTEMSRAWLELQTELVALSTSSDHRMIETAGHYIQLDEPGAVIQAIEDVLAAVRQGTPVDSPGD